MTNIPEFHGNPNDLVFNPEFVLELKTQNTKLKSKKRKLVFAKDKLICEVSDLKIENAKLIKRLAAADKVMAAVDKFRLEIAPCPPRFELHCASNGGMKWNLLKVTK